jgi:hypothetical protein
MSAIPASLAAKEWQPIPQRTSRNASTTGLADMAHHHIYLHKMHFFCIFMGFYEFFINKFLIKT